MKKNEEKINVTHELTEMIFQKLKTSFVDEPLSPCNNKLQENVTNLLHEAAMPYLYYFDKFDCEIVENDKETRSLKIVTKFTNPSPALRDLIERQNKLKSK